MRILVFGKNGQVGNELSKFENVISLTRSEANFLNPKICINFIDRIKPSIVINAVAKTNVDLCENEKIETDIINTRTPIKIAKKCKVYNIPFIHLSTDYVFDGKKTTPYREDDFANPINYYGLTKLNAERGILKLDFNSIILRTSWVFSKSKKNFISKIIDQLKYKKKIDVVYDQNGSPTSAKDIASTCIELSKNFKNKKKLKKIYHYSSYPVTNFYHYAKEILKYTDEVDKLNKIKTSDYPLSAIRPKYTYLNCDLLKNDFGINRPNWKKSLKRIFEKTNYV